MAVATPILQPIAVRPCALLVQTALLKDCSAETATPCVAGDDGASRQIRRFRFDIALRQRTFTSARSWAAMSAGISASPPSSKRTLCKRFSTSPACPLKQNQLLLRFAVGHRDENHCSSLFLPGPESETIRLQHLDQWRWQGRKHLVDMRRIKDSNAGILGQGGYGASRIVVGPARMMSPQIVLEATQQLRGHIPHLREQMTRTLVHHPHDLCEFTLASVAREMGRSKVGINLRHVVRWPWSTTDYAASLLIGNRSQEGAMSWIG